MRQHLNLNYTREHTSDAKVPAVYPTAITRRVLRCGRRVLGGWKEGARVWKDIF